MLRPLGVLDRYVLKQWIGTFLLSAVGVPTVAVTIDLAERFSRLSDRNIPVHQILLGELFLYPSKMAILVPAAVLFATVFTLNGMGRHSELTAVQGGGISFYRLILPMILLAALAVPADYQLQEIASYSTTRQKELHHEISSNLDYDRTSFAYASPRSGWTWAIEYLLKTPGKATGLIGDGGRSSKGQRWTIHADSGVWNPATHIWTLRRGATNLFSDSGVVGSFRFRSLEQKDFTDTPVELMQASKNAEEMTTAELRAYLDRLAASGAHAGTLSVELPLKYAVPMACLVVALFGAPLAITNARAGAAVGLAIALGTTLAYLTGTQIMKAIGGKEMLSPILAAWSMNAVFLLLAIVLLARVKS